LRNRSRGKSGRSAEAAPSRNPAKDHAGDRRRKKGLDPSQNRDHRVVPEGTAPPEELAVLFGAGPDSRVDDPALPMLHELAELARTAEVRVVGRLYQKRPRPDSATYLGSGKATELRSLVDEAGANMVISDDDLSPAQVRNLEEVVNVRVLDRSELILDIFARHARTQQARLQVELAQLKYQAPRLKRMWTHLSRIVGTGGIASRGPGEKQLEVDRRLVKRRIEDLQNDLREIEERRDRQVRARGDAFKAALVGYTNAGKSTLMNALTGADVLVADMLFATLDTRTRKLDGEEATHGIPILVSDTVGFIDKLPHHLVASFHATLAEVRNADVLLHVVDASDAGADEKMAVVRGVLAEMGASEIPELAVLNKSDLVTDRASLEALRKRVGESVVVSGRTGHGIPTLRAAIRALAASREEIVDLSIPAGDGRTLAKVAALGAVRERRWVGDRCEISVSMPRSELHRFEKWRV
jgi:GTP-binding protein HflX